ncbi:uncharacterized protein LOC134824229 [Bolinopsis microptera]|uniref:uncharacterized protein LOC134824229 n=1 Tax=Bolinopsis microptera TaxID=2820187 RepID=UPI003078D448
MMTKKSKNNQKSADSEPKVEAPKLRSRDVIYKRKPGSENVNTYNRLLLLAIQGNMDVQICMSPWDVVNYVISYATKNEKEVCDALKDVIKNIDQPSNKNSKEALRQLGNTFLNSRSVSVQEAIFRCLPQLSLSHFKPSVLFIPSDMPGDRHGIVKPRSTLQQLPDDSEDVFHNSLLDKYLNRPDDLESICWAQFASLYVRLDRNVTSKNRHKVITLKSNLGQMIRRDSPQVIRSNKKSRTKQPEKYYYSKLCLYFPWRKEADLIGSFATYQESFAENVDAMKPNIKKFEQFDDETLQKMEAEIRQEIKDSLLDENKREVLDGRHLFNHPFEGIDISKEEEKSVFNVTYKEPIVSDEQYQQMVTSLNDKQRELFNIVDHHSSRVAQGHKVNQLLHFVSGAGGVGKSFLIKCMRSCISRKFPDSIIKPRVAVAASTGVAAALIDGQTVHQLLQLDCQEGGRIQPKPLNPKKKMQMRRFFQHVRYIIIDEVSMVGNTNLNQINSRLNEIFGVPPETTIFGGINVIFSGDLHQIPAVQQTMVFETKGIAALGPNIWKDSITFSELTDIVRAKGDSQFTELCHRLRVGEHTPEDIELLGSRVVEKQPKPAEIMDSMVIYPTNRQCNSHNQECIQELSKTSSIVNVVAQDRFSNEVFNKSSNFGDKVYDKMNKKPQDYTTDDVNKTAGLPTSLNIGPGARVMVRVNIDTPDKIVNGVTGTVHSFQLQNGKTVKDGSCSARDIRHVNVMFDDVNVGRTIKHHCDNFCANNCTKVGTVPIKPVEKEFISKKNSKTWLKRYQIPLVLSWACTVHKVQGLTLNKAYVFLAGASKGHSWQSGMAYTAISRLTSLLGLHFISFDPRQIRTSKKVVDEYARLRDVPKFCVVLQGNNVPAATCEEVLIMSPIPSDPITLPCSKPCSVSSSPHNTIITSPPVLKRHIPFSPLADLTKKHFKATSLYSPLSMMSPQPSTGLKRPLPNSPQVPASPLLSKHLKTTKSLSPLCNADVVNNPVMQIPTSYPQVISETVGRAHVIDFLGHPQSAETATLLQSLGFSVNASFANIQVNSSCGYIASRVISKLKSFLSTGQSWFNASLFDCNYWGASDFETDICALGNHALNISGTSPVFLSETNCLDLIPIYSLHFHNLLFIHRNDYLSNVEPPHSKSTFKARIIHLWDKFKSNAQVLPPTLFIVNTDDGHGVHWYTVILEIGSAHSPSHEL